MQLALLKAGCRFSTQDDMQTAELEIAGEKGELPLAPCHCSEPNCFFLTSIEVAAGFST